MHIRLKRNKQTNQAMQVLVAMATTVVWTFGTQLFSGPKKLMVETLLSEGNF